MAVLPLKSVDVSTDASTKVLGGREVQFLSRQESSYPQLMRLCMDFDFTVVEQLSTEADFPIKKFMLTTKNYRQTDTAAITPAFASLDYLEAHVNHEMTNILHDYLFGFVDEEIETVKEQLCS